LSSTRIGCFGNKEKGENELCGLKKNNCKDGLKCVDREDGCDNDVGRCVKSESDKQKASDEQERFDEQEELDEHEYGYDQDAGFGLCIEEGKYCGYGPMEHLGCCKGFYCKINGHDRVCTKKATEETYWKVPIFPSWG